MEKCGFLYCIYSVDGNKNKYFTDEFLVSLKSLQNMCPKIKVSLYTNIKVDKISGIDNIIYDEDIDQRLICKAKGLLKSPYDKTILLDTDTVIHKRNIRDVFKILDEFEFTCCHGNAPPNKGTAAVGSIYPDLNTGLLGVNNNDFTRKEINKWINSYNGGNDQLSFRNVVFMNNKNKFYILPPYFMLRSYHYIDYPGHAVLTHDHDMSKKVISKIIETWNKKYLNT